MATAVAPDPTEDPSPPEDRANVVPSSSDVWSAADGIFSFSVVDDDKDAL